MMSDAGKKEIALTPTLSHPMGEGEHELRFKLTV